MKTQQTVPNYMYTYVESAGVSQVPGIFSHFASTSGEPWADPCVPRDGPAPGLLRGAGPRRRRAGRVSRER